jgi:hypothetical protein
MKNISHIKATNQIKKYILLQMIIKKFILVKLPPLILQFIKMKRENKDILIDIRRMNLNIGINQELIHLHSGLISCYGIYLQHVQVLKILKNDLIFNLT